MQEGEFKIVARKYGPCGPRNRRTPKDPRERQGLCNHYSDLWRMTSPAREEEGKKGAMGKTFKVQVGKSHGLVEKGHGKEKTWQGLERELKGGEVIQKSSILLRSLLQGMRKKGVVKRKGEKWKYMGGGCSWLERRRELEKLDKAKRGIGCK